MISRLTGFGFGFKAEHFQAVLDDETPLDFIEIHAENYMGEGGLPHAQLRALREKYQLSLHGVGLSLGGETSPCRDHLARLKKLITLYTPESFSEHLAWSSHGENYYNDLLPLAYNHETLARVCRHIDAVQTTLNRQMLLENPSTYLDFTTHTYEEVDFIAEIVKKTGCGLLLDVNNLYVSAVNHGKSADEYLKHFPFEAVKEIHLAGFAQMQDEAGLPLLIDSHSTFVAQEVFALYAKVSRLTPQAATLIEWDEDVPSYATLKQEALKAKAIRQGQLHAK